MHIRRSSGTLSFDQIISFRRQFDLCAGVVKLVNTRDLKSLGRKALPVQVRPPAPFNINRLATIREVTGSLEDAYQRLTERGYLDGYARKAWRHQLLAYRWMADQMRELTGPPPGRLRCPPCGHGKNAQAALYLRYFSTCRQQRLQVRACSNPYELRLLSPFSQHQNQ